MTPTETETQILERLGVRSPPAYVLTMDQAAHMDWDWSVTFLDYFFGRNTTQVAVQKILTDALALLKIDSASTAPGPAYYYSLCEIGFRKQFVET